MSLLPEDFDKQAFLLHHWQQNACLIKNTGNAFTDWLSADELAGLSCEPEVESRLILTATDTRPWQVLDGPFDDSDFSALDDQPFNLLVQAVDHYVPSLRQLWAEFDFLPHWRIDDVMVNASSDQGSVGPHFDFYDVFLIQGQGQKRWQTGQRCDNQTGVDNSSGLKLLSHFTPEQEWLLNPGDILYVPAGMAHHGIAVGNSTTYSLGFRAPAYSEMVMGVAELIADQLHDDKRYRDGTPSVSKHPAEIPSEVVSSLQAELLSLANNPKAIQQWFGETMTYPRDDLDGIDGLDDLNGLDAWDDNRYASLFDHNKSDNSDSQPKLWKRPGARFAYLVDGDQLLLFADGQCHEVDEALTPFIQTLCDPDWNAPVANEVIIAARQMSSLRQLILALCQCGTLYLEPCS